MLQGYTADRNCLAIIFAKSSTIHTLAQGNLGYSECTTTRKVVTVMVQAIAGSVHGTDQTISPRLTALLEVGDDIQFARV